MRKDMNPSVVLGGLAVLFSVLAASVTAMAQTSLERGRYLVDTVMTCQNCHTPRGPNGFEFDKALSGGLRFDEPPFDVWATNITPDRDSGIGNWSDAEIKTALQEGKRPTGHQLAEVMPSGFYKILTPRDLDGIVAYLRSLPPVEHKVPAPSTRCKSRIRCFPGPRSPCRNPTSTTRSSAASTSSPSPIAWNATRRSGRPQPASTLRIRSARAGASSLVRGACRPRATSPRAKARASAIGAMPTSSAPSRRACARMAPSSSRRWAIPFTLK